MVNGRVNNTNMGFINILSNPKTTATSNAVEKPATLTPVIKWAISKTKTEVTRILVSNFISVFISKV